MNTPVALLAVCLLASTAAASDGPAVPVQERARGADTVVVGRIIEVTPTFERNAFGDQLIVSHTLMQVEESLKGTPPAVLSLDVEGGTVGGVTMTASDMEPVKLGDRAVFFLIHSKTGANVPYLRHNGIVKLDATDHVRGTGVPLDEVKRLVKQGIGK